MPDPENMKDAAAASQEAGIADESAGIENAIDADKPKAMPSGEVDAEAHPS